MYSVPIYLLVNTIQVIKSLVYTGTNSFPNSQPSFRITSLQNIELTIEHHWP